MGDSIEQRAANGDDEDPELFPLGQVTGGEKTLKNLIPPSASVKSTVSLASAEVPGAKGIFDPEKEGRLLVSFALGKVETLPLREEGKVVGWKVRQTLIPTFVERVDADGAMIEGAFETMLAHDEKAAAKLLDKLRERAGKALVTA